MILKLKIAYMDHLDIPADRTTHKINYSIPRICHVSNNDFKFVEKVDGSRLQLNAYGQQPFRKINPYPTSVPMTDYIPPPPPMLEEEAMGPSPPPMPKEEEESVLLSLKDWLDCPGTSSHHPVDTPAVAIESLTKEYQVLLAQHNSLVEKGFDELARAMKEQGKVTMAKRGAELASKLIHLNKRLNDVDLASKMSQLKKPSNDNANVHPPSDPTDPPAESPKKPSSPVESTRHASTSSPPIPPEDITHEPTPPGSPIPPEDSTKDPTPSPPPISPKESTKEFEDVCAERSRSPTPTRGTTIEASKDREIGSSTIKKRNRKKRKRIHVGLGLNKKNQG
ncbi:uncharacterized protein [Miscanthus floridulus]|uniref:uncharacterized protein isoform X2 n=1 Tax=Miscanthus floridulus TaxID=154761 RepID=UPI0034593C27